jgi:hypothetical protein
VEKSHQKFGMKCNWITEVKTAAWKSDCYFLLLFLTIFSAIIKKAQFNDVIPS